MAARGMDAGGMDAGKVAMSDGEKQNRPNAHYRLSNENANPDEIVYHYNRDRRLEKAPQAVRDMYRTVPPRRFGFFRSLVDNKPKIAMLITIFILCAMIFIMSTLGVIGDTYSLDGNQLKVEAIEYEGTVIVSLRKTIPRNTIMRSRSYTGAVDIAVLPAGSIEPENAFFHRIFFTVEQTEHYRFAIPFEAGDLMFVFQTEKRTLNVKVTPE
jgi:hypothetical protein